MYYEQGIGQVFFEMFGDTPLQCQEFQFGTVIVLLRWCQCSATKCYRVVASIVLLL